MSVEPGRPADSTPSCSKAECAVGFKMRAGAKLIVEARTGGLAAETFAQVLRQDQAFKGKTAKLAPNLFFAQAEVSGMYWSFEVAKEKK